ncbi:response regulator [Tateyamaria omphalii]|uniref:DNA-binding response regulator n=1 Tax=Tateyamaria omphalii TaxID=299262 RepID=A0A1P8N1P0_9RHOB|nr:response regulator transcription factor [Tateyamaria omphalii]APX14235.1 DNA-binding response regulator [Tateyamaria omphalii]
MSLQTSPVSAPSETQVPQGWALVIDDHPLFCDALELTLRSVANFAKVVTADSLERGLQRLSENTAPSLILLDLNLPDVDGLDGLMRLKRTAEATPVIIVSSMTDNSIIANSIIAGAQGFVPKHSHRSVFLDAIQTIAAGDIYKPAGFVEGNGTESKDDPLARLSSLTNQQARILDLICEGKLNKQIAFDLSIAETTVKAHVTAIMRKLGVQSRTQAVLVAQEAKYSKVLPTAD